jgi:hypothetical protein
MANLQPLREAVLTMVSDVGFEIVDEQSWGASAYCGSRS